MENEKKLFEPIVFEEVDPRIAALERKTADQKIYLVLYERYDDDGNKYNEFMLCKGRDDCYRSIDRLLHTYPVDIHNSSVLVEIPGINIKGKAEWMMKGISNALSIYEFCKVTEKFFGETAFDIEEFNNSSDDTKDETFLTMQNMREAMNAPVTVFKGDVFGGNKELVDVYNEAMKDK